MFLDEFSNITLSSSHTNFTRITSVVFESVIDILTLVEHPNYFDRCFSITIEKHMRWDGKAAHTI